ncbi:DUF4916 domain-containing protein [Arthrobacter livingstonensis]
MPNLDETGRQDALELTWMTPEEVLSPGVQSEVGDRVAN